MKCRYESLLQLRSLYQLVGLRVGYAFSTTKNPRQRILHENRRKS